MAAKKAPAKKMAAPKPAPKKTGTADSSKLTASQKAALAKSAKSRTDRYGNSGMGETKTGVELKDMAALNKGLPWWERYNATEVDARGNVTQVLGRYGADTQARMEAIAAAKKANAKKSKQEFKKKKK